MYKYRTVRDLRPAIVQRIQDGPPAQVWTPVDFLDLGNRPAVDKVLQRLFGSGQLRRIDRGLYATPRLNRLTNQPAGADYRQVLDALARRDQLRMLAHLSMLLADGRHGRDLRNDLRAGLATLPAWMQDLVRDMLGPSAARTPAVNRRRTVRP